MEIPTGISIFRLCVFCLYDFYAAHPIKVLFLMEQMFTFAACKFLNISKIK